MSVATWSLRERLVAAVCRRRRPGGEAFSILRCTSSRSIDHPETCRPVFLGDDGHAPFDVGQILGADDALPGEHLGVGREPRISWRHMRLSKSTEAV